MREIKFRAWDKEVGVMRNDDEVCRASAVSFSYQRTREDWVLMQSTGLKDKNGVLIYEGDVVATCWHTKSEEHNCPAIHNPYQVEWNGWTYILTPTNWGRELHNKVRFIQDFWVENTTDEQIEVIGNIYENPTLIE